MAREPVVIRPRGWQVAVEFLLPLLCLGFIGWNLLFSEDAGAVEKLAYVAVGGGSLLWLWHNFLRRAWVAPDRLDYFNSLWTRGIDRRDVKGTRGTGDESSNTFTLVAKDPECSPLKFPNWIIKHPEAAYWFDDLPDLDAVDTAAAEAALAADPTFGSAPEVRRWRVKIINYLIAGLTLAVTALCFVFSYGWTNRAAVLAVVALPFVAILLNLVFPKVFRLANENGKSDPRPTLGALLYVPSVFLPMAAFLNLRLFGGVGLLAWALPSAMAAIFYLGWRAPDLRRNFAAVVTLILLTVTFFWGAFAYVDVLLDSGPRRIYGVQVEALRMDHSSDDTTYYATLAPWGRQTEPREETIGYRLYDRLHVGDSVCVTVGWGLFGTAWYDIDTCPARSAGMQ